MDYVLFEHFAAKFAKQYGCDPRESPRARLRLMDSIEKLRKLLSQNKEAEVHIDSLLEDNDLRLFLTRDEFEALIKLALQEFNTTLI